jgi:hypothetical protein
MPSEKTWVDTCYICNTLQLVSKHYSELMCHNCYHLILRLRRREPELTRDEFLTKAVTRRAELKGSGKWGKDAKYRPNIPITILK